MQCFIQTMGALGFPLNLVSPSLIHFNFFNFCFDCIFVIVDQVTCNNEKVIS